MPKEFHNSWGTAQERGEHFAFIKQEVKNRVRDKGGFKKSDEIVELCREHGHSESMISRKISKSK